MSLRSFVSFIGLVGSIFIFTDIGNAAEGLPRTAGLSAYRDPKVSGRQMMQNYEELRIYRSLNSTAPDRRELTSYEARTSPQNLDLSGLPDVSADELKSLFEDGRDHRPFMDDQQRQRRPAWLYPDDGCYARAQLVVDAAKKRGAITPLKVFIFGNLWAQTPNSPAGRVSWWYHVAPIIKSNGVAYVIDPAIEAHRPMTLTEWLASTTDPLVEVAVCASASYDPDSGCKKADAKLAYRGLQDGQAFLDAEWERVEVLGRDPQDELGDVPPWLTNFHQVRF